MKTEITPRLNVASTDSEGMNRLQTLCRLSMMLSGDPADIFERIASMIGELLDVPIVCLSEIHDHKLHFLCVYNKGDVITNAGQCPLEITPCATVEHTKDIRVYDHVADRFPEATFLKQHNAFAYCGIPSLAHDGNVVAVTCLLDDKPHEFSEEDQDLLCIFGQRIGTEIERQKYLNERRKAENALRKSEQRFRDIAEVAGNWIWEVGPDLRFTYLSGQCEKATGIKAEAFLGRTRQEVLTNDPNEPALLRHLEDLEARRPFRGFEYTFEDASGKRHYFRVNGKPVFDAAGRFQGYLGSGEDITERKRAEEEIHKLNHDLERRVEERTAELRAAQADLLRQERLATLGQLTATVSHELRNPLGVIRTSNFVVRDGLSQNSPRIQRALERIDRNVIRCDRIIDELLDFTRISGIGPESTSIDAWVDETLNEQARPTEISLRRDFGLPNMTVRFDRDRFRRAVINVFDNACQAMTGKDVARTANPALLVKTRYTNDRVEVIFEDCGPGIPADVLPKIFEPLFSTKGFGVGLGLTVVKQIMQQHGGGVEIDSARTGGTRACLWLPGKLSSHCAQFDGQSPRRRAS
jgi:PAS domain S-box-containing protein